MRKRKVTYPVPLTSRRPPGTTGTAADAGYIRTGVIAIDLTARAGKKGLVVGSRVKIGNTGLYAGEAAVIVSLAPGVIPSAVVKTEAGRTRRVRTIDLEPITAEG